MSSPTTAQKFTAEAIGTAILVFIGAGSVPLTVFLTGKNPFGSAELSTISFAFAFAIFAAVYAVGHISGAHINPAVTIALLAAREIGPDLVQSLIGASTKWEQLPVYIVGPILGGLIGAFTYEYIGRHETATVPAAAVAETGRSEAVQA